MSDRPKILAVRDQVRSRIVGLRRPTKQSIAILTDLVGLSICACGAEILIGIAPIAFMIPGPTCLSIAVISVTLAWLQGLYRSVVRYMGSDLFVASARVVTVAALLGSFVIAAVGHSAIEAARWGVAFWCAAFIYVCASRYIAQNLLVQKRTKERRDRVIIFGAGAAGAQLAVGLFGGDDYLPIAFVDSDDTLSGKIVKGLTVYSSRDLERVIRKTGATRVLLATPSASRRERRKILEHLAEFPVHVQTIPDINDLVTGKANVDDIRDVDVNDLLGRDPVPPNESLLHASIAGKAVLITGAGGSIGSELCRQILRRNPRILALVEISEPALYHLERELRATIKELGLDVNLVPLLGSVHHEHRLREIVSSFGIDSVYHAAAYKHVPIVEHNIFEGIHNNVLGTLHCARAAMDGGADSFVLISTDKAVNPTNVMGATKRFSELVLQAYNNRGSKTRFSMVRFGNVLESSGSVVPLFKEQIRKGGPVTVTHRDIIRYFMTIPEAAQLVIQAGAMAKGGDVFVLDMGKPVKILDLAHRMISLMGMTVQNEENPDGDIEIQFVGLRPAEKLYEELLIGSNVSGTDHPRIMRADEDSLPIDVLDGYLRDLAKASQDMDFDRARKTLLSAVEEYNPHNDIDDWVWLRKKAVGEDINDEQVIDFPGPTRKD